MQNRPVRWPQLGSGEALARLGSRPEGLTSEEAARQLERYGPNELSVEERPQPQEILLRQLENPLIYILLGAALVSAILGQTIATAVILVVEAINTSVGFVQEYKAEQTLHALARITAPRARIVRDGEEQEIDSRNVVPGDVVLLRSGAKVPADLRLLRQVELEADESILTGEATPVFKNTGPVVDPNAPPGDQVNMAFTGTTIVRGRGAGVAVATGSQTLFGRISDEVRQVGEVRSPLQVRLDRFTQVIAFLVLGATVLIVALGLVNGQSPGAILLTGVSTAVATVPEGLPITITVALATGVYRMAQRRAIVRKLPAIEALGSTTTICSDKTGTLTKSEMTVTRIHAGGRVYKVTATGYTPRGEITLAGERVSLADHPLLELVLRIGMLANASSVYQEEGRYRADGDPTEAALIVAAMKGGLRPEREQETYPVLDEIPFESARQYMATLNASDGTRVILVKGAPERILAMSETMAVERPAPEPAFAGAGHPVEALHEGPRVVAAAPLDRQAAREHGYRLASQGLRVLAMAYKAAPPGLDTLDGSEVQRGLVFAGLQGMIDPPREEAVVAAEKSRRAGIKVRMITGDNRVTAEAIARRMGIVRKPRPQVIDGRQLEAMGDAELYDRVEDVPVFARAAPEQKLRIVQQLRRRGEVVALTGDGVNDAPALKQADIGVAMGITGTDVAKEAADMVITDDNLATIYAAIEEGRVVFDNIRKVIAFLIPTGLGLVLTVAASVALQLPLPFLPTQAIWINLVTNGLQDVALAFEPAASNVGTRAPRDPRAGLLSPLMVQRTVLVGGVLVAGTLTLFTRQLALGASTAEARTVAMTTMVLFQNFHIFNSRSFTRSVFQLDPFSNPFLLVTVAAALGLHAMAVYLPPFQFFLDTVPLSLGTWVVMIAVASSVLFVIEIDKAIRGALGR